MGRPSVSRAPEGAGGVGAHLIWSRRSSGSHREGVSETVEGASEGATLLWAPRAVRNVPEDEGAAVEGPEPRRTASQDVLSRAAYMVVKDPPPADPARRMTVPRDALEVAGRSGAPCTRPAQWQADAAPWESSVGSFRDAAPPARPDLDRLGVTEPVLFCLNSAQRREDLDTSRSAPPRYPANQPTPSCQDGAC